MTWTKMKPTKPGWYAYLWKQQFKRGDSGRVCVSITEAFMVNGQLRSRCVDDALGLFGDNVVLWWIELPPPPIPSPETTNED